MKIVLTYLLLTLAVPVVHAEAAETTAFRANFEPFVGLYQIVGCVNQDRYHQEVVSDTVCGRKMAHIYYGNDYQVNPNGPVYFFNLSDSGVEPTSNHLDHTWIGIDLATDPAAAPEQTCTTSYGYQFCTSKTANQIDYYEWSSISTVNGLTTLHRMLLRPTTTDFLFTDTILTLKKIEAPLPAAN
jgi:hypothetical protein